MIFKLTGKEIVQVLAKHAAKEFPELHKLDGKPGEVNLIARDGDFFAEFDVDDSPKGGSNAK